MLRSWLGKPGDTSATQHAPHLTQHISGVRNMVKRVKTQNSIDRFVRNVETPAVEEQKLRFRSFSDDWLLLIKLTSDLQRRWRYISRDNTTAELRQVTRSPTRAGAEFQHRHSRTKIQSLQHDRKIDEELWHFFNSTKRLGEMKTPIVDLSKIMFGEPIQILERIFSNQLLYVDCV